MARRRGKIATGYGDYRISIKAMMGKRPAANACCYAEVVTLCGSRFWGTTFILKYEVTLRKTLHNPAAEQLEQQGIGTMATTGWLVISRQVMVLQPIRPGPTTPTGISLVLIDII